MKQSDPKGSAVALPGILALLMLTCCDFRRMVVSNPLYPQALETLNLGQKPI